MKPKVGRNSQALHANQRFGGKSRNGTRDKTGGGAHHDLSEEYNNLELNSTIQERFHRGSNPSRRQQPSTFESHINANSNGYKLRLNPNIRQYFDQQQAISMEENAEPWSKLPEIPSTEEVNLETNAVVKLPANRIEKPYKSAHRYIRTHFQLLREDAVSPLRDAIDQFKKNPNMQEDQIASIYDKVRIVGVTFSQNGIAVRIKFSTARIGKRILWSSSKRLTSGSIIAISRAKDGFREHCAIGIIAARPLGLVDCNPPQVDIYFSCPEEIELDPQKEFIMIEAKSGYYEAHRHTLRALQKLNRESFPLSEYVIGHSRQIGSPQYLNDSPFKNLTEIVSKSRDQTFSAVNIIDAWPNAEVTDNLDQTQWEALQQMLTKSFAVIQGPPGTGKTHISVIALKIMIQNSKAVDPPIIVAAQTNHALDQLLEHISEFEPGYIRLGGQSTNSEIKKRALHAVRQDERIANVPGSGLHRARARLDKLQDSMVQILSMYDDSKETVSAELLYTLGVLSEKQKHSLEDEVSNWISAESSCVDAMEHWLHKSLIPFQPIYHEQEYGFEEIEEDLEFEQLKECEAEHGVSDEEDIEMIRGRWQAISDQWTVVEPSRADIESASKLLDSKDNLWTEVPEYLRGPVYWVMRQRATANILADFREAAVEYNNLVKDIKIGRWEKDAVYLSRAKVIGMTTTGLSKYRPLIASLRPKIILIEEAAEVVEAPVAVACVESLEHLILVGDHLQLRGHCAVQELEGPDYNLNVSMFERLVKLNIPFKTLLKQRRMRPEFRKLISSLYPNLIDHPDVMKRDPPEWGTGQKRSFFFSHQWLEDKDETYSTFNEQEAIMVARFYRHLLQNGVPPGAITILAFYNGHRKRILKEIRNDPVSNGAYTNVKTVDSYQGKESSIIILSLARNNLHGGIGFLENANRVCVALSRARDGFYIFGNADLLSRDPLWHDVVSQMIVAKRIGTCFPVHCSKHNITLELQYPRDWDEKCPEGGCNKMCGGKLPCGHACGSMCHAYKHETIPCHQACNRTLICGHACNKKCHERCSCACSEFERLMIAKLHTGSSTVETNVYASTAKATTGSRQSYSKAGYANKVSPSKNFTHSHHGERHRSAGRGRNRFVQEYNTDPSNAGANEGDGAIGELCSKTNNIGLPNC